MDILNVIKDESCETNLRAHTKEDCLHELADLLAEGVKGVSCKSIYDCLVEREEIGSTGFDDGIAIPHGKIKGLDEFVMCIAISRKGINFESVDGKKTHIFFIVIGPEDRPREHLQLLAQISRISRNSKARKELLKAPTSFVLKEVFARFSSDSVTGERVKGKEKLLMIILYEQRFLEDIMDIFLERGVRGASVIESTGIRDQLSNIPLFSNFFNFLGEKSDVSKTIMAIVHENEIPGIVNEIEEIMGNLDNHTGAMVMALDLFFLKGSMEV